MVASAKLLCFALRHGLSQAASCIFGTFVRRPLSHDSPRQASQSSLSIASSLNRSSLGRASTTSLDPVRMRQMQLRAAQRPPPPEVQRRSPWRPPGGNRTVGLIAHLSDALARKDYQVTHVAGNTCTDADGSGNGQNSPNRSCNVVELLPVIYVCNSNPWRIFLGAGQNQRIVSTRKERYVWTPAIGQWSPAFPPAESELGMLQPGDGQEPAGYQADQVVGYRSVGQAGQLVSYWLMEMHCQRSAAGAFI